MLLAPAYNVSEADIELVAEPTATVIRDYIGAKQ